MWSFDSIYSASSLRPFQLGCWARAGGGGEAVISRARRGFRRPYATALRETHCAACIIHSFSAVLLASQNSTMSSSPTPSEREKADAELKEKEAAEQATLPYKWTQSIKDVDITVPVPGSTKGRDLDVKFTKTHLKVAIKGQAAMIDVCRPTLPPLGTTAQGC